MDILPEILQFRRPALRAAVLIVLIINAKLPGLCKRTIAMPGAGRRGYFIVRGDPAERMSNGAFHRI
jgi:hypothetical protein